MLDISITLQSPQWGLSNHGMHRGHPHQTLPSVSEKLLRKRGQQLRVQLFAH